MFVVTGCCYLKCVDVLQFLLDILCDDSSCKMFGAELTHVVLKDILSIRSSWFSLNASICHGVLQLLMTYRICSLAFARGFGENPVQTRFAGVQKFARDSATIPVQQVRPVFQSQSSRSSLLGVIVNTDCPSTRLSTGPSTRLSTVGNRAFPVTAARVWNKLPHHLASAPSLQIFHSRLETHPFSRSSPTFCSACEVTCVFILISVLNLIIFFSDVLISISLSVCSGLEFYNTQKSLNCF